MTAKRKRTGDEEIARLKSRVFDFLGRQDVEPKPANKQNSGGGFGHAKLPVAQGRRAVLPDRDLAEEREVNVEARDDEQRVNQAVDHLAGARLGSVETRQKICAATLQLRSDLTWKCELDPCVTALAQHAQHATETEGRSVLHDLRIGRMTEFLRLCKSVFDLTQAIDQLVIEGVATRENTSVGDDRCLRRAACVLSRQFRETSHTSS